MNLEYERSRTLGVLDYDDLSSLRQRAIWATAYMEAAQRPSLARWNAAVREVLDDEEQRRRGASGAIRDTDHHLRVAAATLTGRERFLLLREYQITISDVEAHWGRSYIPFLTMLRDMLHRPLSRRRDPA